MVRDKEDNLRNIRVNGCVIQSVSDYAVGDMVYVLIRPEDVTFTVSRNTGSARNVFGGRITRLTSVGSLVRIEVDCGFPLMGLVTQRSTEELDFTIGKEIYASFKATAIHTVRKWR